MKFTTKEAVKLIRTAPTGMRFFLRVIMDSPIADCEGQIFTDACCSNMKLSRNQALALATTLLPKFLEERGGRIPITVIENTCWIG